VIPQDKLIIALDVDELEQARTLVGLLRDHAGAFKIGKQLFTRYGPESVRMVLRQGGRVFLDLKYHDIPATVARAAREAVRLGAFMFNVHATGGHAMMRAAAAAVRDAAAEFGCARPALLAVTVLTSLGPEDLRPLGIRDGAAELVGRLALLARDAGMDGVVASPNEIALIRQACGADFLIVTPGIRPLSSAHDDQKRTMTPGGAIAAGADYLVVGRPVTAAADPAAALLAIRAETTGAHSDAPGGGCREYPVRQD
jgi:orotidine-5'-phosphate decarboxylase